MIHKEILNDVDIPVAIISVLEQIKQRGFRGYIVGGAIRDVLIGRVPVEYDLATNAHPSDIMAWFDHVSDAGLKYGTVSIHFNGHIIEVTTFRKDAKYLDFRHPSEVVFTSSIHDDLMRRDFTINAMAYCPLTSECIDNFGAIDHLNQRRLICVGHPYDRFKEDMLRPFRCFRLLSQLGFVVASDVMRALHDLSHGIVLPSMTRIRYEMDRLLMGPYWLSALKVMHDVGWLSSVICDYPPLDAVKLPNDRLFRWAWLLSKTNLNETAKRLHFSKSDRRWMAHVLEWQFDENAIHLTVNDLSITSQELMGLGFTGPQLGQTQNDLLRLIRQKKLVNSFGDIHRYLSQSELNISD